MDNAPLVSVIIPAFNAQACLSNALASVQSQSIGDLEIFLVDDGSTDATLTIARDLAAKDGRIKVLELALNKGAAQARNAAIAQARGRYIAFLDADDTWMPAKLSKQLALMARTGAALSYTGFLRARQGQTHAVSVPASVTYAGLLKGNVIACSSAIYDTRICGKVLMPDFRMRQDYATWLSILAKHAPAVGMQEALMAYHVNEGSLSANKLAATAATWRIYRDHAGLSRLSSLVCLLSHSFKRIRRG